VVGTLDRVNGRRGGVILVFHDAPADVFRRQLDQVAQRYTFIALDEFVDRLIAGKSTTGVCAITCDDGIGSVTEAASALALERGWPMTFYLPTRYLDTGEPYWFFEMDPLLARAAGVNVVFEGMALNLGSREGINQAWKNLRSYFIALPSHEAVTHALRRLRSCLFGVESRPEGLDTPPPIPWERVRQLARHEELSFEAHGVNHLALSRLADNDLIAEMEDSRARIQGVTGRPVRHFCYPYGSPNEVGRIAPTHARSRFRSATTTTRGRCAGGVDLALLPRVPLDIADSEEVVAFKVGSAR
jgi:peptidoglycan/xylan/chitin deacetylase (PgdA/CDA1 family)